MAPKKSTKSKETRENAISTEGISPRGFETIAVETHSVACDGGKGALGHPRVYLEIAHGKQNVVCPYCSRTFIYVSNH